MRDNNTLMKYIAVTYTYGAAHAIAWTYKRKGLLWTECLARCGYAGILSPVVWPLMAFNDLGALECHARGIKKEPFMRSFLFMDDSSKD